MQKGANGMMRLSSGLLACAMNRSGLSARPWSALSAYTTATFAQKPLRIERTTQPKDKVPNEKLKFGHTFSDHMLMIEYDHASGWGAPAIVPHGPISLDPAASCLHYAIQCFEGMKAYRDTENHIRMFRPDKNMARLQTSSRRLQLPDFDAEGFLQCIKELLRTDKSWIPQQPGYSMYLRPTFIATTPALGVAPASRALLYVLLSPVGPYYPTGFKPVSLLADTRYVRAWPGGTGGYKVGCNYAPGIMPASEASEKGYQQILWLFGDDHQLTEVGTMNLFVFLRSPKGYKELVTPPLDGTILPGITRDSILQLARQWNDFKVSERSITMTELIGALEENRVIEVFGAGTAAIVSPVNRIGYNGKDYAIPLDSANPNASIGKLADRLVTEIQAIQYGKKAHPWSVLVD